MRNGASLLVGARPGGAGKTTVMCALLNFLPDRTAIRAVESPTVLSAAERDPDPGGTCYLAHEIGSGPYYAYVWGREAQAFFRLVSQGHIIACNLHADTLAETQAQLCRENPVDPAHLAAVTLKVYIEVSRGTGFFMRRRVNAVYESDGTGDRLVWALEEGGRFVRQAGSSLVCPCEEKTYAGSLEELSRTDVRTIEAVRTALLDKRGENRSLERPICE
jgi:hypothetical protein